jgi:hypothetical protein
MRDDGQVLVNLGLVHRDNEWQPYWQDWLEWMREEGWRRFGLYVWDQGAGMPAGSPRLRAGVPLQPAGQEAEQDHPLQDRRRDWSCPRHRRSAAPAPA